MPTPHVNISIHTVSIYNMVMIDTKGLSEGLTRTICRPYLVWFLFTIFTR
jgi:hypothetical protein